MKNYNYIILLFVLLFSFNINAQQDDQEVTAASRKAEKLSEASNSSTIITEKEVSNKKSYNVLSLLDNTVGVNVVRHGVNQFNVSLREGVDIFSTQTILLSDGRELNTYGLNFFDASASTLSGLDIAKIEVVRGSSSAVYGIGASSGVISFTTKDPFEYPGTTVQVSSGGINNSGGSIIAGRAKKVESNWSLFNVNLRHADHNQDKTFGYKINLKYSENNDWLVGEDTQDFLGGELPLMTSFNFDTSLYFVKDNYDLTATFGLNDTGNIQRRAMWGEELREMSSKFLNLQLNTGDLFVQYNYVQNDTSNNYNYWFQSDMGIDSRQSHVQVGYDFSLPSLSTELSAGADHRVIKFDTGGKVFGVNENDDDYRTYGASIQSKTKLSDNIDILFQGRYDHFSVLNEGAFSPKGVIIVNDNWGGTLRLSMSQSSVADNAYTLFSDFPGAYFQDGYLGPMGNKNAITFNNPTWQPGFVALEGLNAFHPAIDYSVLGLDHFSAYLLLAGNLGPFLMQNFMATGNPLWLVPGGGTFIGNMLSNGGAEYTMFDLNNPSNLSDSDKSVLSTETTYELGYSGKIGNKLSFSVDVYNIRKQNVLGTKRITPQLSLNPTTFANEFASTFGNTLAATYASLGLPAAAYSSILNTITTVAAGAAAQTAATIQQGWGFVLADQNPADTNRIYWGHYNFGDINYWGTDIAMNYEVSDNISLFSSYSFLSQTEFSTGDLGEEYNSNENYHLNMPKHRAKGGLSFDPDSGVHLGISFRYQSSMNINSVNTPDNSGMFWYDGFVPKRTVWDISFGLPVSSKTRFDLTVDNVSGKKYQSFGNMPMIGQQALITLTHDF